VGRIKRETSDGNLRHVAAVFDLDGTITKRDTYLEFLKGYAIRHPQRLVWLPALGAAWGLYSMRVKNNSWLKQVFLRLIAGGASRAELDEWTTEFIERLVRNGLRTSAPHAIEHHRRASHTLIMATASFDFYVERLAARMGFDHVICTRAAWTAQDTLTGQLAGRNCYGEEKVRRLKEHFGSNRLEWYIHGYSDHHSDVAFLAWVDRPVAVNPARKMSTFAKQLNFDVADWDR
jgi:HAD superfamily hydrolase (TIGR01490 family)